MNFLGKEIRDEKIPPAPFEKRVAKLGETNKINNNSSQRKYKKLNPEMEYVPYNLNLKDLTRKLRNNMTQPERKFWKEILSRDKMEGLRFLRQKSLGQYIVDFYCSALMLVIEVDGNSHFTDEGREYDKSRTKFLETFGIKVIRYTNKDVMENMEEVYLDLKTQIELRKIELS